MGLQKKAYKKKTGKRGKQSDKEEGRFLGGKRKKGKGKSDMEVNHSNNR